MNYEGILGLHSVKSSPNELAGPEDFVHFDGVYCSRLGLGFFSLFDNVQVEFLVLFASVQVL